jgi:hypothetical protein
MPSAPSIQTVGESIWAKLKSELGTTPVTEFDELLNLRDLAGNSTGYIEVVTADKLVKMSSLSITMGPGRYFNIHVIPEPDVDLPRYLFEGMAMPNASQISMDLFPDNDVFISIKPYIDQYAAAIDVYNKARKESDILFEPSKQAHMRAFSSPLFLCTFGLPDSQLAEVEEFAHGYLDAWLDMYKSAGRLDSEAANTRQARRDHMQECIIALDPDRDRVVAVYGEETTRAIERASML